MPVGVFSKVAHRIAAIEGERYPLHVGDSWLEPLAGARMEDLQVEAHPGMHRYTAPVGLPGLLETIADRRGVDPGRVLVSAGATSGLGAVASTVLDPGDEVLLLCPFWPLIRGIIHLHHGVAVEVGFYDKVQAADDVARVLDEHRTDRTCALYINSPNNPSGRVLPAEIMEAVAEYCRRHDLWIWSDEVYEDYSYAQPHTSVADLAPERTICAFSFSKAYAMAGNRCGYLVGPDPSTMATIRRASTHHYFCAPQASQLAAIEVLQGGDDWLAQARAHYQAAGDAAADVLGLPRPEGGTFLFMDVAPYLDERGLHGFLLDCIERGLILAPGSSCGAAYDTWVRICFTSAPPDVVARGVAVLADLTGPSAPVT
jgi:N-succinyldiaminopimelate aminotransferase